MTWESALLLGVKAVQNAQTSRVAKRESEAIAAQGTIDAKNKAEEVRRKAASLRSSFLTSGLSLEGTPSSVLTGALDTGRADVNQVISNANIRSKNVITAARSKMMENIAGSFQNASFSNVTGSIKSGIGTTLSRINPYQSNRLGFGVQAYNVLEESDNNGGML